MSTRTETYHICDRCRLTVKTIGHECTGIAQAEIYGVGDHPMQFDLCMGCRNQFYLAIKAFVDSFPNADPAPPRKEDE